MLRRVIAIGFAAGFILAARLGPASVYPPNGVTGATDPVVTQATIGKTICVPNYTARVRNVTEADKAFVLKRDGQTVKGCCEVDHLISLELGGSNDRDHNLWAELYAGQYGARIKDQVENKLHRLVCSATDPMPLNMAQSCITKDWVQCGKTLGIIK